MFAHGNPIQAKGPFSHHGEILAYQAGWDAHPMRTIRQWLGSPSHRSLVLGRGFPYAAAAIAKGRYGGGLATISVVQFGRH